MIVRDEEAHLPACLASARGLFDEVVVVDTGSRDATREVARSFGAEVIDFDWCNDFSAARNLAQARCHGDYVFWMDADETLPESAGRNLARLLSEIRHDQMVYAVSHTSLRVDGSVGVHVVPSIRLVPNRVEVRWVRRVYERVLLHLGPSILHPTLVPVEVAHHGFSDWNVVVQKLERNKRLVEMELQDDPSDHLALYNLASTHVMLAGAYCSRDEYIIAGNYIRQLVGRIEDPGSPANEGDLVADAYSLLCWTLLNLLSYAEAMETCVKARTARPYNLGLLCREASLLAACGMWEEARARWQLMPRLRVYKDSPGMRLKHYAELVGAKTEYAYFLEENDQHYDAAAVWTELAADALSSFDAVFGVRRTLRRILRDAVTRPLFFLDNLKRTFEPKRPRKWDIVRREKV